MGSGEFDGGGSVMWEVINSDGESGGGNKSKCKGKDKDPKDPNGQFVVLIPGWDPIWAPIKSKIKILWGPESSGVLTPSPTAALTGGRKAYKKKRK